MRSRREGKTAKSPRSRWGREGEGGRDQELHLEGLRGDLGQGCGDRVARGAEDPDSEPRCEGKGGP